MWILEHIGGNTFNAVLSHRSKSAFYYSNHSSLFFVMSPVQLKGRGISYWPKCRIRGRLSSSVVDLESAHIQNCNESDTIRGSLGSDQRLAWRCAAATQSCRQAFLSVERSFLAQSCSKRLEDVITLYDDLFSANNDPKWRLQEAKSELFFQNWKTSNRWKNQGHGAPKLKSPTKKKAWKRCYRKSSSLS